MGDFQNNFFRVDPADSEETGLFTLHLRPGFAVHNPDYGIVGISFAVDADILIPLVDSDDPAFNQLGVGLTAKAAASFFPEGMFSFIISDEFKRDLFSPNDLGGAPQTQNRNSLGADISFHPGGRAIDISLSYRWNWQRYDVLSPHDKDVHELRLLASWKFYPLTYAFLEATFDIHDWREAAAATDGVGERVPGMPVKVYLGVSGYIRTAAH